MNNPIKKWTKHVNRHLIRGDLQMANKYMKRRLISTQHCKSTLLQYKVKIEKIF